VALQLLQPLREAADAFWRTTDRATPGAPHVRDALDLKRVMLLTLVALLPVVATALWNTGLQANLALAKMGLEQAPGWRGAVLAGVGHDPQSTLANVLHGALYLLPVYVVAAGVGGFWELLFAAVQRRPLGEGLWVTGLLFALTLPPLVPLWQVALGISFGVVVGQELFGGYGRHLFNTALLSRAFLYYTYPDGISGDAVWVAVDGYTGATPLAALSSADPDIGMDVIDPSWTDAFLGAIPGSMGETSALACAIGAAFLIATGIASWRVVVSALAGGLGMAALLFHVGSESSAMFGMPPHWHLVTGGFAFGVAFLATDPATSAQTNAGRWLYGLMLGSLAVLLRVTNPGLPEGIMMSILLANVFAPLIDWCVEERNIARRAARHG